MNKVSRSETIDALAAVVLFTTKSGEAPPSQVDDAHPSTSPNPTFETSAALNAPAAPIPPV